MDVRAILTFLLPFLKEVIFGKPVYEKGTDKRTIHSSLINYFQSSRRATASLILIVFFLAASNAYTFRKLMSNSVVNRESIVRLEQMCSKIEHSSPAAAGSDPPDGELDLHESVNTLLEHL